MAQMKRARAGGAIAFAALALAGCGDQEPIPPLTTPDADPAAQAPAPGDGAPSAPDGEGSQSPPQGTPSGPAESGGADPRQTQLEREAKRTVRRFVAALDARDGGRACALLAPGVLDQVELPERREGCAASLEASIGYRDPRGLPVWEGAEVGAVRGLELGGATAKLLATVVTRFADRDELSIEDDVVYLIREGGGWLIAKPSSTLYRAVGIADVPPSVLSPP
jgi:hypothetical protein